MNWIVHTRAEIIPFLILLKKIVENVIDHAIWQIKLSFPPRNKPAIIVRHDSVNNFL